jgi:DNA (cytosine-5)-methyltransferase 1
LTSLDFPKIEKRKITEFLEPIVPQKYYYPISQPLGIFCGTAVKKNTVYQRRTYVRENKSSECPTLTANAGTGETMPIIL